MSSRQIDRICLGTAQFGLNYGIANKKGKVPRDEVFRILDYAHNKGIKTLDTAHSYGNSEFVIGEVIDERKYDFKIISKISSVNNFNSNKIKKLLNESFSRLKIKKIHGYLVHNFDDLLKYEYLWKTLEGFKNEGLVERIGFSLYRPQELETIFSKKIDFDILQVPYSVFDRRFEQYFKRLKDEGVEIYARSVFLQGLAFLEPTALPQNLKDARVYLERLQGLILDNDISVNALCLNFVLLNPDIDKAIIGVDSLEHLKENSEFVNLIERVRDIHDGLNGLKIENENLILPYKWNY